jgi:NTE family protein
MRQRVAIACQGGGAHAAFAAGVLKEILNKIREERDYEIVALSGTSGGAICAYLAWYGLLGDDEQEATEKAIKLLEDFWTIDNVARLPGPGEIWKETIEQLETFRRTGDVAPKLGEVWIANEFVKWVNQTWELAGFTTPATSPYTILEYFRSLAPLHSPDYWQDQLKNMIANSVDEARIEKRVKSSNKERVTPPGVGPFLYIGAANPRTGEFQVFKSHKPAEDHGFVFNRSPSDKISVEAILASTAIPFLFEAVHTGKAVYWHGLQEQEDQRPKVQAGVYWDGLYSSNPPIRELAHSNPDEIWVIQINPEEIKRNPTGVADLQDRRNELAGNLSLNQELYFVRSTNELVRQFGACEDGKIKLRKRSDPSKKEYGIIKVRRIELTRELDYLSKLDRNEESINRLMNRDSKHETEPFLKALAALSPFEKAWEKALQEWQGSQQDEDQEIREEQKDQEVTDEQERILDEVMNLFANEAEIRLVPPEDRSASERAPYECKEDIRGCVRWCLEGNFNLEQARYYRVTEEIEQLDETEIRWWMLVTTDCFDFPVKGWAKVAIKEGKIVSFAFYPLDMHTVEKLETAQRLRKSP